MRHGVRLFRLAAEHFNAAAQIFYFARTIRVHKCIPWFWKQIAQDSLHFITKLLGCIIAADA